MTFVKKLDQHERDAIRQHLLALNDADRLLRFGTVLPDSQVSAYVRNIDFSRDTVYGIYSDEFALVAVGHLAFAPEHVAPDHDGGVGQETMAEFGVSVDRSVRGLGLGKKLFASAITHCRNVGVDILYSHCLSSNRALMHIVQKSGFDIQRDHSEADAYLNLSPPDAGTVMQEVLEEQFATLDYTAKANASASTNCVDRAFQTSLIVIRLAHASGLFFIVVTLASQKRLLSSMQNWVAATGSSQYPGQVGDFCSRNQ